jgi:choline dehydrogenase-like flavoprotein
LRPKVGLAPDEQRRRRSLNCVADLELVHGPRSSVGAVKRLTSAVRQRRRPPHLIRELGHVVADPAGLVREVAHRRRGVGAPADRFTNLLLKVQTEQPPLGPSRLTLSDRRDALGIRKLDVAWVVGEEERHACQAMAEVVAEELARCGLGRLETFPWLDEPERFRAEAHDFYHHAGTTRMAADPQEGVVDTDCRVHGLEGLYVTGGSVFPTSGHAHPTLMIVALALRLADHLSTVTTPGA